MSEWKKYDAKWLLAKHGKLGLNNKESAVSDELINKIADSVEAKDGDFDIPDEHQTDLSQQVFPTVKTHIKTPNAKNDAKEMMRQYALQNGSLIVPDGESAEEFKEKLESDDNTGESDLICG